MEYLVTDTLGQLVSQTDTLELVAKTPYAKRMKQLKKEIEEWEKEQEKRKKNEEPYDSIYPVKSLAPNYNAPQNMSPLDIVTIEMPSPLASIDTTFIHLYSKIDTLWYRAPFVFERKDSMLRTYQLRADWHLDTEYSLEIDSAAFTDIYGLVSKAYQQGIKVKSQDDFASIVLKVSGVQDSNIVVQLLDKSDKVVRQVRVAADGSAQFQYVTPAVYYARAFVDRNGNDLWDTGLYDDDQQPEDVYYYYRSIEAKAKWDITQQWNLTARPRNEQKPSALIKQKADKNKKQQRNRNAERARKLGIEYVKKSAVAP
jgi:hypothetical protein